MSAHLGVSWRDACGDRDLEPAIRVRLNFSELLPQRTKRKHAPAESLTRAVKKDRRDVTGSFGVGGGCDRSGQGVRSSGRHRDLLRVPDDGLARREFYAAWYRRRAPVEVFFSAGGR